MVSLRFPLSFNVSKITQSTVPIYMKKKYKIISLFYDIDDDDDDDDDDDHIPAYQWNEFGTEGVFVV